METAANKDYAYTDPKKRLAFVDISKIKGFFFTISIVEIEAKTFQKWFVFNIYAGFAKHTTSVFKTNTLQLRLKRNANKAEKEVHHTVNVT